MPVNYVIQAQAARILKKSKQTIGRYSLKGLSLEAEKIAGTYMIPIAKIKAYAIENKIQIDPIIAKMIFE